MTTQNVSGKHRKKEDHAIDQTNVLSDMKAPGSLCRLLASTPYTNAIHVPTMEPVFIGRRVVTGVANWSLELPPSGKWRSHQGKGRPPGYWSCHFVDTGVATWQVE
jgi:hypothetical protein